MQNGTKNMTVGGVRRVMISFALPIFLSQLFQQLYNTADSLIVAICWASRRWRRSAPHGRCSI